MDLLDTILITIKAAGGTISGRTAIQKLIYFESISGIIEVKYRPHYYGPYSSEVQGTIQELIVLDFVKEEIETSTSTGFSVPDDWKRYSYSISRDGEEIVKLLNTEDKGKYDMITGLVERCKTVNFDVNILSCAAKVNYIMSKQGKTLTREEIIQTSTSFGWKLSQSQINDAIELLKKLQLFQADEC